MKNITLKFEKSFAQPELYHPQYDDEVTKAFFELFLNKQVREKPGTLLGRNYITPETLQLIKLFFDVEVI